MSGVSVPLQDASGQLLGALNVSTNAERASSQEVVKVFVPRLLDACRDVANAWRMII